MIGYALVGSNDLAKARHFYDNLFATVGIGTLREFPNGACTYGTSWEEPNFGIGAPFDGKPATAGNGTMIALIFDSRDKVDAIHARALELGGTCEGAPGQRGDWDGRPFYGAYFRDLDGNKLCAFRVGPA